MSNNSENSYKNTLKATSIFGGVQVFIIIIQILKSKAVAVLIGPTGMGILGLITQTIALLSAATNFGLETSAVKNISLAEASEDKMHLAKTVSVFQKLVFFTGTIGFLVCLVFSPLLSEIVFDNKLYTSAFIVVSISLLIMQLTAGQNAVLQGLRKIQLLAKANIFSALAGLLVAVPIYYFYGIKGIPASITISSLAVFIITYFFARDIPLPKISFDRSVFKTEGVSMLKMGFLLSMTSLITIGSSFLVRIFITKTGSIEDVGFYNAGFAIIESYVGIIFTAMAKDYYPKLSMVSNDIEMRNREINEQTEIALLLLMPILTVFILVLKYIVIILYTREFVVTVEMIEFATLGMFLRAVSWPMAYLLLAKGDSKVFFWTELLTTFYIILFNIVGYKFWGLKGIGVAFILIYFFYSIQIFVTIKKMYAYRMDTSLIKIFFIGTVLIILQFINVNYISSEVLKYLLGTIICGVSIFITYKKLNDKIGIFEFIKNKISK